MTVTEAEFKSDFSKYLDIVAKEDVFITRGGKAIAKVVNPNASAVDILRGYIKDASQPDLNSIRDERLKKHECNA